MYIFTRTSIFIKQQYNKLEILGKEMKRTARPKHEEKIKGQIQGKIK